MPTEDRTHGPATRVAIRNLTSLKPEHQQLLRTLLGDSGMASATLESLVEHLLEEEDARLQHTLARVKAGHATVEIASDATRRAGATVGSLRPSSAVISGPARGTVGSLRK